MQKSVNLVDLVKSFHTSIYNLLAKRGFDTAEIEPLKVWGLFKSFIHSPPRSAGPRAGHQPSGNLAGHVQLTAQPALSV